MQKLQTKISLLERNVEELIRKLTESLHHNEQLKLENNKLKQKIELFENKQRAEGNENKGLTSTSNISEEKYQQIKSEIQSCIREIDECIEIIER